LRTFKLTIGYDGTSYAGWQRQARGDTVQGRLEAALAEIEGRSVTVHGAGRTDAGVHARGQVASFKLEHAIEAGALWRALNAKLPDDIRVVGVELAPDSFHARYQARRKSYRYRISQRPIADPMEYRFTWHVPQPLDLDTMNRAGRLLVGRHDFAAFQTASRAADIRSTVRTLLELRVWPESDGIVAIDIVGEGFLRYMVRTITGTLVEVGQCRRPVSEMSDILASRSRDRAGVTAPPQGLCLMAVDYSNA
jgi:tRNA pseudouridine38-40 synthase